MGNRVCLTAVVVVLAGMAGCSSTPEEGTFPCDTDSECPTDWFCRADERCWSTPDGNDAGLDAGDAGGTDATTADAPTSPDAPLGMDAPESLDGSMDASSSDTGGLDTSLMSDDVPASTDGGLTDVPGAGSDTGVDAGRDGGGADGGNDEGVDAGGPCGGLPMTTFYRDLDGDMHGAAASGTMLRCATGGGFVASSDDCDDGNSGRHPGAPEACNGIDDDCDFTVDGAAANAACVVPGGTGRCDVGVCEVASCAAPRADCDGSFATGCEADTSIDPAHCGSCTNECGIVDSCASSSCELSPWAEVRANRGGGNAVCARRANGNVACWGYNASGVVRPGVLGGPFPPTAIAGVSGAVRLAVGGQRACAVTSDGRLQCWPGYSPTTVPGTGTVVDVAISEDNGTTVCAVRASGTVVCFGVSNLFGDGSPGDTLRDTPGPVIGITNAVRIASVDGGFCALRTDARVSCWSRQQQMCGSGTSLACPVPVTALPTNVTAIHDMHGQFCASLGDGTTTCWGSMLLPTTGAPPTGGTALEFWGPTGLGISSVLSAGGSSNVRCVTTSTGTSCWGDNGVNGYAGRGTTTPGPVAVGPVAGSIAFSGLAGGGIHMCGLSGGSVYCWGANNAMQLVVAGGSRTSPTLSLPR